MNCYVFSFFYMFLFCIWYFILIMVFSPRQMNCTLTEAKVYLLELNCRWRIAERKGTGGCPWDGKLRRMGPSSSCLSISGISVCAIRLGLRRLKDGRPRDGWRRDWCPWDWCPWDGCPWDGCPWDGGRRRGRKTETDVAETEGVLLLFFLTLWKALVDVTVWLSLIKAVVCVCVGVYGYVWRSAWQKEHFYLWDIVLIIELYEVCWWSYYEL